MSFNNNKTPQDQMRDACESIPPDWLSLGYLVWTFGSAVANLCVLETADVNNECVRRPLHLAVQHGKQEYILLLISRGAEIMCADSVSRTALHVAVMNGQESCVEVLLRAGAHPEAVDDQRVTPMHLAAGRGAIKVMFLLGKAGAPLDPADENNEMPIHYAIAAKQTDAVQWLVFNGACSKLFSKKNKAFQVLRVQNHVLPPGADNNDAAGAGIAVIDDSEPEGVKSLAHYAHRYDAPEIASLIHEWYFEVSRGTA